MRKILLPFIGASMMFGTAAMANCWDECVLPNPFGGCGKSVKMCDIENPGKAAMSLGSDINDAKNRLVSNWHQSWGEIPGPLRHVLEEYPITIACAIYPETRGYVLVIGALEGLVAHSKSRAEQAKPVVDNAPDWKRDIVARGQAQLVTMELGELGSVDWNSPGAQPLRDKYAVPYSNFVGCMSTAQDIGVGQACYRTLVREAAAAF